MTPENWILALGAVRQTALTYCYLRGGTTSLYRLPTIRGGGSLVRSMPLRLSCRFASYLYWSLSERVSIRCRLKQVLHRVQQNDALSRDQLISDLGFVVGVLDSAFADQSKSVDGLYTVWLINASAYRPLSAFKIWEITDICKHHTSFAACLLPVEVCLQCFNAVGWAAGCVCVSGEVLARCRHAYGPADATATHCLLLQ